MGHPRRMPTGTSSQYKRPKGLGREAPAAVGPGRRFSPRVSYRYKSVEVDSPKRILTCASRPTKEIDISEPRELVAAGSQIMDDGCADHCGTECRGFLLLFVKAPRACCHLGSGQRLQIFLV